MDKAFAKEYLAGVAALAEEGIHQAAVEETDDGAVLYMTAASPFDEGEELSYSVSFEGFGEDMCAFQIMIYVCTDVPERCFAGLAKVINELNARMTVGSYILFDEERGVMFTHGFLLDETVGSDIAARILFRSIGLMENAVTNTGEWLRSLSAGDTSADEIISQLEAYGSGEED